MPKPITPLVGCDIFILNDRAEVLLIQRSDNLLWALPGGCHDMNETPKLCAERECFEETGYRVEVTSLLGVWSSNSYEWVHYPHKDNQFCHLVFNAKMIGGSMKTSPESLQVGWFSEADLPPLSDGFEFRIKFGFAKATKPQLPPHFE